MRQGTRKPSLRQILWTDYPSFFASFLFVVVWIVYLAWVPDWRGNGPVVSPGIAPLYLIVAIVTTACGLGTLGWRIWLLHSVFSSGIEVRGKISSVSLKRDRGRVEYSYVYENQEYRSSAEIHRNQHTKALQPGDHVILMVDRAHPKRAFIRDLYI